MARVLDVVIFSAFRVPGLCCGFGGVVFKACGHCRRGFGVVVAGVAVGLL